jgi:uncharacterized protein (UPF0332 family)
LNYSVDACKSLLSKAKGKFRSAELSFREDLFDSAVSDLYYSAFQTVCALMVLRGLSIKKHTHVGGFVNKELGLKGIVPLELVKMYNILMTSREDADYKPNVFHEKEYVEEVIEKVNKFNLELQMLIKAELP